MLLSDQFVEIYHESQPERDAILTSINNGSLDKDKGREQLQKNVADTIINMVNTALEFIKDECSGKLNNLDGFKLNLVKSINSFRCAYQDLCREYDEERLWFEKERFEEILFNHYTTDMSEDVVNYVKKIYNQHKFSYQIQK